MSSNDRKKNRILVVTQEGLEVYKDILTETELPGDPELVFSSSIVDDDVASQCNVWFGSPSCIAPLLAKGIRPDWVQSTWAGVEPFVAEGMPTDYRLTNMRGIFNDFIAEYAVGHMMSHALNVREHLASNEGQQWNQLVPKRLRGKTAGILGVGEIGKEVARLCKAMGMNVHGYTRSSEDCQYVDRYFHGSVDEMAPLVDYWVNIMPNTPSTIDILNNSLFDRMKDGAVVINAGRGKAVRDDDLLSALNSGKVDYAVLDVFREEPLTQDHAYWKHPRVLVTSHTAAMTEPEDAVPVFLENFRRFHDSKELKFVVDFERGY